MIIGVELHQANWAFACIVVEKCLVRPPPLQNKFVLSNDRINREQLVLVPTVVESDEGGFVGVPDKVMLRHKSHALSKLTDVGAKVLTAYSLN